MAQKENLAAIDIGSNAIRMVLAEKLDKQIRILKKFRFPIRLGSDVFESGEISSKNLKEAQKTFTKFKNLANKNKVSKIRAVGTSALREANNQKVFTDLIEKKSKIVVEVIDGVEEARLIHLAVKKELDLKNHNVLLIDIGGGSVELTYSENAMMQSTQSFPFGTVRTLEAMKKKGLAESQIDIILKDFLNLSQHFLQSQQGDLKPEFAVGTGGNLETLGKLKPLLTGKTSRSFLTREELEEITKKLLLLSNKDRITKLGMRPDRADVIVPAAMITLSVLRESKVEKLLIPYVGLKEGLLWSIS